MVELRAELTPMRMKLATREPVEMLVEVVNNTNKAVMLSLDVVLDNEIAFDKGGRSSFQTKKFDSMQPGERFRQYYDIFPKANVSFGIHDIQVIVAEHYNNSWEYVTNKKVKNLSLRVE
jgi:hypothetical protein